MKNWNSDRLGLRKRKFAEMPTRQITINMLETRVWMYSADLKRDSLFRKFVFQQDVNLQSN